MTQNIEKYTELAAKVTSFLLQNLPWDSKDTVKSDMQVLTDLAGTILSNIKETELGKQSMIQFAKKNIFSSLRPAVLIRSLCAHWKLLRP